MFHVLQGGRASRCRRQKDLVLESAFSLHLHHTVGAQYPEISSLEIAKHIIVYGARPIENPSRRFLMASCLRCHCYGRHRCCSRTHHQRVKSRSLFCLKADSDIMTLRMGKTTGKSCGKRKELPSSQQTQRQLASKVSWKTFP